MANEDVVKVNCRIGSLEITFVIALMAIQVNCRIGSLEIEHLTEVADAVG